MEQREIMECSNQPDIAACAVILQMKKKSSFITYNQNEGLSGDQDHSPKKLTQFSVFMPSNGEGADPNLTDLGEWEKDLFHIIRTNLFFLKVHFERMKFGKSNGPASLRVKKYFSRNQLSNSQTKFLWRLFKRHLENKFSFFTSEQPKCLLGEKIL